MEESFDNEKSAEFYDHGLAINFLILRLPQQNGVAERRNRVTQEMARTMLNDSAATT